jgi:hypothetical protein
VKSVCFGCVLKVFLVNVIIYLIKRIIEIN